MSFLVGVEVVGGMGVTAFVVLGRNESGRGGLSPGHKMVRERCLQVRKCMLCVAV